MGEHGSGQRIPIKQIYKSLVELQHFSTFRLFKMIAAITVTTVVACMLRLLFNDQEPFSFDIAAMLSTREIPTTPLVLYAVGAVPISLRAFVPEAVLDLGLATLAVGTGWLAIWLFTTSHHIATYTMTSAPPAPRGRRLNVADTAGAR